jgi:glyoxylase-like metal-dependent hydrolase (beta-lactamase superfamily II)
MPHPGFPRLLITATWFLSALAAAAVDALAPQPVAPGVYVVLGAREEPSPANGGRVSNLGIIVGDEGAIVIGTGTSEAEGEALLKAAERLASKPVVLAVNTYAAPDQVLGNGAFTKRGIPVIAHEETERFLAVNCNKCIDRLKKEVGPDALAGTEYSRPTRIIKASTVEIVAGRKLDILYFGPASQRGDLAVYDRESGVLFAGALASFGQVPDLQNADIEGWLKALRRLGELGVRAVVPAHGPVAPPERLSETAGYLHALKQAVQRAYDAGASMLEAGNKAEVDGYRAWALYEPLHRKNVHFVYLQIENRDIAR